MHRRLESLVKLEVTWSSCTRGLLPQVLRASPLSLHPHCYFNICIADADARKLPTYWH
jgi:hypothetical protein